MLKLLGGTHFLSLTRDPGQCHKVDIRARFDEVLSRWTPGTRVSPILAINGIGVPALADGAERWIVFAGPLFPGNINPDDFSSVFLGFGAFNAVFLSKTKEEASRAQKLAESNHVQWEEWHLRGHELLEVTCSINGVPAIAMPIGLLNSLSGLHESLTPTVREYCTLMATTVGRSQLYMPQEAEDLERFDRNFRRLLSQSDLDDISKQGILVNANAALSRHSSQTYSGISPIIETECPYWTHSLLGVGTASLALLGIRKFIESVFTETQLITRLTLLENTPPSSDDLLGLPSDSDYWDSEHLFHDDIERSLPKYGNKGETLPLITCFSGRDGFRSTVLSLSVPLELITSCNTTSWTPLTLTHEISHTLVEAALAIILPRPDDQGQLKKTIDLLTRGSKPKNSLEDLRRFLSFAIWHLQAKVDTERLTPALLGQIIRTEWKDLNETLTHIFDFLYFYEREPKAYIESIWTSWGVIPNIQNRVPDYIIRSLCAIHVNNIRPLDGYKMSLEQLQLNLIQAKEHFPNSLIDKAISELQTRSSYYLSQLKLRIPIIKAARGFLYQPRIASSLFKEPLLSGGDREGYNLVQTEFNDLKISNPLRFVRAFAGDQAPNTARSAWLLFHLAFGGRR